MRELSDHLRAQAAILSVAAAIKGCLGLRAPLHPLYLARAVGLSVRATHGLGAPAVLDGKTLRFDESYPNWRRAVGAVACGQALVYWEVEDSPEARCALAAQLGTPITDDGTVDPDDDGGPRVH